MHAADKKLTGMEAVHSGWRTVSSTHSLQVACELADFASEAAASGVQQFWLWLCLSFHGCRSQDLVGEKPESGAQRMQWKACTVG